MNVNNINKTRDVTSHYDYEKKDYTKVEKASENQVKPIAKETDSYISHRQTDETEGAKTYTRDTATINRLKMEVEGQTQQLRDIVKKLITQQGDKYLETGILEIDSETSEKAQEAISEDGYWGVKQTSERIFDFAKALTGGDPDKAQSMKDTFIKAFKEAEESWGGQLPEISYKTYDATIEMFDKWIAEGDQN